MDEERWHYERIGLGHRVVAEAIRTEIKVTRVKRRSDGIHGEIMVKTDLAGVKTINGIMHMARFNLSSSGTRSSLAKMLESRTPGMNMDWFDGLEALCQHVMIAESEGQPFLDVGNQVITSTHKYIIDPVVPANVATLFYGPGGSGKSVLALAMALSIRNGREIIPGLAPAAKGNVLYLDWETDGPIINERAQAIGAGAGFTSLPIIYRRCIKPLADEAEEIANAVAERDIVFTVIDSAGMAMGTGGEYGDANESTLRMFDAIRFINTTTLIVDHVSKQEMRSKGKVSGLLPYGSIYKVNLARSAWEVRNGTTPDDETVQVALIHTKANDSRLHDQVGLQIEWLGHSIAFQEAESSFRVEPRPAMEPETAQEAVLDILSDGERMAPPAMIKMLPTHTEGAIRQALRRLTEQGSLIKMEDGTYRNTRAVDVDDTPGQSKWNM